MNIDHIDPIKKIFTKITFVNNFSQIFIRCRDNARINLDGFITA